MKFVLSTFLSAIFMLGIASATPKFDLIDTVPDTSVTPVVTVQTPLGDDYEVTGAGWKRGGDTILFYKVIEHRGKALVCGAYMNRGKVPGGVDRQLLRDARVFSGRTVLTNNLMFFNKVSENDSAEDIVMDCRVTRKSWQSRFANTPEVKFRKGVYEY
ncbi:hypothetical protein [Parasulfitobacter algicola]|uniref:Uncharacterized protein n=1 Tax=Parasulfitobacter algicola TaxID=2614809 RepID=A0ABX2IXB1_9RHOB|nr:hypothetical protein [Sulfitobacter algicola]NSX55840.1 hypothetical protein [Sulfitobacter algicola]